MNADVLLARCRQDSGMYGMRVEERPDAWYATWAFRVNERRAANEGYGQKKVNALLRLDQPFPGCPHCGANSFVKCGMCGKLSCWTSGERHWTCAWSPCTGSGAPNGDITDFTQQGDL